MPKHVAYKRFSYVVQAVATNELRTIIFYSYTTINLVPTYVFPALLLINVIGEKAHWKDIKWRFFTCVTEIMWKFAYSARNFMKNFFCRVIEGKMIFQSICVSSLPVQIAFAGCRRKISSFALEHNKISDGWRRSIVSSRERKFVEMTIIKHQGEECGLRERVEQIFENLYHLSEVVNLAGILIDLSSL